jgi:hypothetical protein
LMRVQRKRRESRKPTFFTGLLVARQNSIRAQI